MKIEIDCVKLMCKTDLHARLYIFFFMILNNHVLSSQLLYDVYTFI